MPKKIYLDNAAATPIDPRVVSAVTAASRLFGNPSAFNDAGRQAAAVLMKARKTVADFLHAHEGEVVFCASGSEANTLAIIGTTDAKRPKIVTTPIEHRSVLQPAGNGSVVYVPVDGQGVVDVEALMARVDMKTRLVSVMYANNEIGTIQPINKIARRIAAWRKANNTKYPLLHVDACQATAYLDMNVQNLGVDLLTFNGSKVYGPRGIAVLYVRRGIELVSQTRGGSQERSRRAGTENVPAAAGLAAALTAINKKDALKVAKLRDYFISGVRSVLLDALLNGPEGKARLANNVSISIPGTDSENVLLELDKYGIAAGSGSACTAHSVEPSHVLKAIGTPKKYLDGVLRFSLSRRTTKAEIDYVLRVLPLVVTRVRARHR